MSKSFEIRFLPNDVSLRVPEGTSVFEAARSCGLMSSGYCGGTGRCGKCGVEVLDGAENGIRLACTLPVVSDMTVRIPEVGAQSILTSSKAAGSCFHPALTCRFVPEIRRSIGDCRSEWELFTESLGLNVHASLPLMSDAAGFGNSFALLCGSELLGLFSEKPACFMAAYDIGTTTVVCYLLDAQTGAELAVSSILNPQVSYGADVISRARYALEHGGNDLQNAIRQAMNKLLSMVCNEAGVPASSVWLLSVAGNTCMHHLLLGLSPASLVTAPYNAALRQALTLPASELGVMAAPQARVLVLPDIAGFVGADTVAGLMASDLAQSEELTLLIDIGTNGELVLGDKHGRIACSTAAGPAFEGAMIHCGMRGAAGAVDHVRLENGKLSFTVIGGGAPKGICGSGLVDLVAVLLDAGVIDESGRMLNIAEFSSHMGLVDDKPAFFLENGVALTQKDIRELQLAKAAMAAGIRLLCAERGVSVSDIRRVLIAGAFGNYLDPRSACRIGLLPMTLLERIDGIGNAAGEGAKRVLRDIAVWDGANDLAFGTDFLELASRADFQDCFVDEMSFPEVE